MSFFRITPVRDQPSGWHALSIFGIPIYIELGFLFFMGIIFLMGGGNSTPAQNGLFCFIIFFSILFHELGHALACRWCDCEVLRISLVMFGGATYHGQTTRGRSLIIVLMGPLFTLILAFAAYFLSRFDQVQAIGPPDAMFFVLANMAFVNIFLFVYNMIPIYPMDGGQAFFHTMTYWIDPNRAMLFLARFSMVLCVALGALAVRYEFPFVAILCLSNFMWNLQIAQVLGRAR